MNQTQHLNDLQVRRCAESLILNDTVNYSHSVREHLKVCKVCKMRVDATVDVLEKEHRYSTYHNLQNHHNNVALSVTNLGVVFSIVVLIYAIVQLWFLIS